jgi:DNA-binding transcriptional LysR family regulator
MELRQLEYLVAVVDHGGFRAAARVRHTSQPPLTTAIRSLERELGVKLLERTTRGSVPTAAGHEFTGHARVILRQVEEARGIRDRRKPGIRRTLRVGITGGMLTAAELTAPIFDAFRLSQPDVDLVTQEMTFADQTALLKDGRVDIALVRPPIVDPAIEVVPIAEEPRCFVVGPSHPLHGAERVALSDVLGHPMLALDAPPEWAAFWQLDRERGRPNVSPLAPPVASMDGLTIALCTSSAAITASESTARQTTWPYLSFVRLAEVSPSVTAIAFRRGDKRRTIQELVEAAVVAAERNIGLLPGGRIPARAS